MNTIQALLDEFDKKFPHVGTDEISVLKEDDGLYLKSFLSFALDTIERETKKKDAKIVRGFMPEKEHWSNEGVTHFLEIIAKAILPT